MLGKPIPDGEFCPLIKGQCVKRQCVAWQQIHGQDPQTGKILDDWGCSLFRWMPKLILEGAQQSRQAGAAVESFRNEMVKGRDALLGLASETKRLGNG